MLRPLLSDKASVAYNRAELCPGYSLVDLTRKAVTDPKREFIVPDRHAQSAQCVCQRADEAVFILRGVADEDVITLGHSGGHVSMCRFNPSNKGPDDGY